MKSNICIFVANKDISKTLFIYEDIINKSLNEFNTITIINFYHFLRPKKSDVKEITIKKINKKSIFLTQKQKLNLKNLFKKKYLCL